jgi:hypothetical protein
MLCCPTRNSNNVWHNKLVPGRCLGATVCLASINGWGGGSEPERIQPVNDCCESHDANPSGRTDRVNHQCPWGCCSRCLIRPVAALIRREGPGYWVETSGLVFTSGGSFWVTTLFKIDSNELCRGGHAEGLAASHRI